MTEPVQCGLKPLRLGDHTSKPNGKNPPLLKSPTGNAREKVETLARCDDVVEAVRDQGQIGRNSMT